MLRDLVSPVIGIFTELAKLGPTGPKKKKEEEKVKFFSVLVSVLLSASVERFSVSRMRDFFSRV